jgi:glutamine synthetase
MRILYRLPVNGLYKNKGLRVMTINDHSSLAERLAGIDEIECVTPDLNGVPRGKVMTAEGFFEVRRLQLARGVLLQCIMGGYPPARFYSSDDGDLVRTPTLISPSPRALQPVFMVLSMS